MPNPYFVSQLGWPKILHEPSTENNLFKKKNQNQNIGFYK